MRKPTCVLFILALAMTSHAADWPQYRADAARTGYTPDEVPQKLACVWEYEPPSAPDPAWQGADTRMPFDRAYHVVVANGLLYFGSSGDCTVYALDAATGRERWSYCTDAPVRLAPAVWKDRVFATSDDGHLYCLDAASGELLWKQRGGPRGDMVLGNDRMVGRWPARGGVAVDGDIVYYAAGIWPSEGIYLYALDAATGDLVWLNDTSGGIEMDQPHGTARAKSGVSIQGYLVVSEDRVFAPTGRAVPAAFSKSDGTFDYFQLQVNRAYGGSPTAVIGPYLFNNRQLFEAATGDNLGGVASPCVVATPDYLIYASGAELRALPRANMVVEKDAVDRKGQPIRVKELTAPAWAFEAPCELENEVKMWDSN